ncbi:hypothetical protein ACVIGA_005724 [Bradyrhizobium sp. USDA 3240]
MTYAVARADTAEAVKASSAAGAGEAATSNLELREADWKRPWPWRACGDRAMIGIFRWRTEQAGSIQVVSGTLGRERVHLEAPAAKRLQTEIKAFLDWFNTEQGQAPVITAALAHLRFVTIHSFEDGTGRIGRAIADLALVRSEQSTRRFYSMSRQIRKERKPTTTSLSEPDVARSTSSFGSTGFSVAWVGLSTALR